MSRMMFVSGRWFEPGRISDVDVVVGLQERYLRNVQASVMWVQCQAFQILLESTTF